MASVKEEVEQLRKRAKEGNLRDAEQLEEAAKGIVKALKKTEKYSGKDKELGFNNAMYEVRTNPQIDSSTKASLPDLENAKLKVCKFYSEAGYLYRAAEEPRKAKQMLNAAMTYLEKYNLDVNDMGLEETELKQLPNLREKHKEEIIEKFGEKARRRLKTLEERVAAIVGIGFLLLGALFSYKNITGNIIGLNNSSSNWIGGILFILGLIGVVFGLTRKN
jgi:hypothetical protein